MTDVSPLMYDRKTAARFFNTIHDILRSLSLEQSLLEGRNASIWRMRVPMDMRLSGTDGLIPERHFGNSVMPGDSCSQFRSEFDSILKGIGPVMIILFIVR